MADSMQAMRQECNSVWVGLHLLDFHHDARHVVISNIAYAHACICIVVGA